MRAGIGIRQCPHWWGLSDDARLSEVPSTRAPDTIPPYAILRERAVSHTIREKSKLLGRVRRIRGQVEALERALDAEKGCAEVLHQIAAVRGAINGLMTEVLEEHVRTHIADPSISSDAERTQGAKELIDVLRAYIK